MERPSVDAAGVATYEGCAFKTSAGVCALATLRAGTIK
jgi:hypothetical protein